MTGQLTRPSWSSGAVNPLLARLAETVHFTRKRPHLDAFRPFDPVRIPYGAFHFKFQLAPGFNYSVEACTDLKSWQEISRGSSKGEVIHYIDSAAYKFTYRFYRVRTGATFSESVIGYAAVSLPPGHSMISNPFVGKQTVGELFCQWPNGTQLSRFDPTLFKLVENRVQQGKWTRPDTRMAHGEGVLFFNPTSDYKSATFVGEVLAGRQSIPVPSGFCIRGSLLPLPGALDELEFPLQDGDVIHLFDRERQKYVLHPFEGGAWSNGPAVIGVGESFWVAKSKPATWSVDLNPFALADQD